MIVSALISPAIAATKAVARGGRRVAALIRNRRAVLSLAELDEHALKDIGLTRSAVLGALQAPLTQDPSAILAGLVGEGQGGPIARGGHRLRSEASGCRMSVPRRPNLVTRHDTREAGC